MKKTGFPSSAAPIKHLAVLVFIFFCLTCVKAEDTNYYTPGQYLMKIPRPVFCPTNILPRLSMSNPGFIIPDLQCEMTTNWGYGLKICTDWTRLTNYWDASLANTWRSNTFIELELARKNPTQFPLIVQVPKEVYYQPYSTNLFKPSAGFYITNAAGQYVSLTTNFYAAGMNTWPGTNNGFYALPSLEGDDADWTAIANLQAAVLKTCLASNCNVAIVEQEGEEGLSPLSSGFWKANQFDPRWIADMVSNGLQDYYATNGYNNGNLAQISSNGMTVELYYNKQKARQMKFYWDAFTNAAPKRQLYAYYNANLDYRRFGYNTTDTNWDAKYSGWGWSGGWTDPYVDIPSYENYFQGMIYFTNNYNYVQSWSADADLLRQQLTAVGYTYWKGSGLANHLSWNWVSGGWAPNNDNTNHLADIPTYMGFLKCLYTSGMIGGAAGYFPTVGPPTQSTPTIWGGDTDGAYTIWNGTFPTNIPPHWISQIMALGRVHAQFSWLSQYLYNGTLLPGNGLPNTWCPYFPNYEFTNNFGDINIRTLAREITSGDTNRWLITCWAPLQPSSGTNITVNIPTLGTVNLIARPSGAVYVATPTTLTLQDTNGVLPTEWMESEHRIDPPTNLHVAPK